MAICMSEVYAIFLQNALRQANKLCALQKLWLFYYFIPCLSRNATPTMTLTMIMSNTLNSRNTQIQLNARFCNASLIGLVFAKIIFEWHVHCSKCTKKFTFQELIVHMFHYCSKYGNILRHTFHLTISLRIINKKIEFWIWIVFT